MGSSALSPERLLFLELGDNPSRRLGRLLGNSVEHRALELPHHAQVDEGARDVMLQAELRAHLGGEFHNDVGERRTVSARLLGLLLGPCQLVEDDPLHMLQTLRRGQLLIDDLRGTFQGDHLGGGDARLLGALGNRRLADAEMLGRVGLGVPFIEELLQHGRVNLHLRHRLS
jgi:hypothetical protein